MYQFNRKTVTYEEGEHQVSIVVREAGRLQGLKRLDLVNEALEWLKAQGYEMGSLEAVAGIPTDVFELFMVARFERSACLAATQQMEGVPEEWLSIEGFANLAPETLVIDWVNAAYELNDHWEQAYRRGLENGPEGDEEKKDD